jgi:hypothetical protein
MKRILAVGTGVLLASTMLGGVGLAQGFGYGMGGGYDMRFGMMGQGYEMWPGLGMGMMGRGRTMMMDLNDDGVVGAEEAASAADEVFTAMDGDDDGKLTKDEFLGAHVGTQFGFHRERQAAMQQARQERFDAMDANSDGSVSKAEFLDVARAHHMAADADGDGRITPWEYRRQNWN